MRKPKGFTATFPPGKGIVTVTVAGQTRELTDVGDQFIATFRRTAETGERIGREYTLLIAFNRANQGDWIYMNKRDTKRWRSMGGRLATVERRLRVATKLLNKTARKVRAK
jgi:hypothetical protein